MAVTNVVNFTGYSQTGGGGSHGRGPADLDPQDEKDGFWELEKCVKAYTTYLDSKRLEIEEQQISRRYRHGAQWTNEQIKTFNDRKQPVVTYNKIGQKIDGIVGTVERLKQDPKAFPRTPAASGRRRSGDRGAALSDGQQPLGCGHAGGDRERRGGRPRRHRARSQDGAAVAQQQAAHHHSSNPTTM